MVAASKQAVVVVVVAAFPLVAPFLFFSPHSANEENVFEDESDGRMDGRSTERYNRAVIKFNYILSLSFPG